MSARLEREHVRLIKPTRSHTPTEYNLRYKRWPQHAEDLRNTTQSIKKGKLVKAGRIWSSSKPKTLHATNSVSSLHLKPPEPTGKTVPVCESDSIIWRSSSCGQNDENEGNDLTSTLQTIPAHLHYRPRSQTLGYAAATSDNSAQRDEIMNRPAQERAEIRIPFACRGPPKKPRKAWREKEEEENHNKKNMPNDVAAGLRQMSLKILQDQRVPQQPRVMNFKCAESGLSDKNRPDSKLASPKNTTEQEQALKETSDWRYYFPEEDGNIPRLKSGVKHFSKPQDTNTFNRKKNVFGEGINEENLRKIYAGANAKELLRLKQALNGSMGCTYSREERLFRNQYPSIKNELPTDTQEGQLTNEDFDKIRLAAFKSSQKASAYRLKDEWMTSYTLDYCQNLCRDTGVVKSPSNYNEMTVHTKENSDKEPEIKEDFKSKDLLLEEGENEIDEEQGGENNDFERGDSNKEPVTYEEESKEKPNSYVEECIASQDSSCSAEKILEDAASIEEREFRNLFEDDGKPKMKFETTSDQMYKKPSQPCRKLEEPFWANPAIVCLGSGHWNVLQDHYDGWEVQGEGGGRNVADMIPKKSDRKKYKIKVYEQGEPCPSRERVTKSMVMGNYGGGGKPRKTHINFVTEYMGKFTRMPLPRRKVRS